MISHALRKRILRELTTVDLTELMEDMMSGNIIGSIEPELCEAKTAPRRKKEVCIRCVDRGSGDRGRPVSLKGFLLSWAGAPQHGFDYAELLPVLKKVVAEMESFIAADEEEHCRQIAGWEDEV